MQGTGVSSASCRITVPPKTYLLSPQPMGVIRRGWLTRLAAMESDQEEFERLEGVLTALALQHGLSGGDAPCTVRSPRQ